MKIQNQKFLNVLLAIIIAGLTGCKKNDKIATTITDVDGNVYNEIVIGSQTWMKENLKTTKFNDGTPIPLIISNNDWKYSLSASGYCWYNNDISNKNIYGALYNWPSIITNNLCPIGWHVPTKSDWSILTTFLGGLSVAGGKMKETGTMHWSLNIVATNESNFTALPGGFRYAGDGTFNYLGNFGYWWSSTQSSGTGVWHIILDEQESIKIIAEVPSGQSVRCIKD
jgi:uncharacterized protein (TIGR02145 family)